MTNFHIKKFQYYYRRFRCYVSKPKIVVQSKPVIVEDSSSTVNPIFIIGIHRSGTSLARRIINSHSNIACPPETMYLLHFASMLRDQTTFSGFEGLGFDKKDTIREVRVWASRYHEAFRLAQGKSRWADKTPQYIDILNDLNILYGPKTQYIMVFRNPLDVIYSIYSRGWKFGDFSDDLLVNTARYVASALNKQLRFMELHNEKCFCLNYDELMTFPESTLMKMFVFLEEPWEQDVLKFNKFNHGFGLEDPIVRGTKGLQPSIDNWKSFSNLQLSTIKQILKEFIIDVNLPDSNKLILKELNSL